MKLGKTMLAAAALALCGTSAVQAGQKIIGTPPTPNNLPANQSMFCDLVYIGTDPAGATFTTEIMDMNGTVVNGPVSFPLAPGQGFALQNNSGTGAWCRFTVDGSTKKWRGLAVFDDGSNYTVSIPGY